MSVNNFLSNPFVIKIERRELEEDGENGPKELREEYPIDLEEIKVEGNQNTTTSDDVNYDFHPEDENSENIFVVDGILCEEKPEKNLSGKKRDPMSKCEICNKEYSKYYLKEHRRRHTGEKRHKCKKCPSKFVSKSHLTKHMLTHTGKKPYQCNICSSNFRGKANLNRHILIHTGEKPWQCRLCPMKFRDKSTMVGHEALHTADYDYKPFQCNFCPLKFRFRSSLNQHRFIHAPEKPFQCHDCGNKYYSKKSLRAHLKAHP